MVSYRLQLDLVTSVEIAVQIGASRAAAACPRSGVPISGTSCTVIRWFWFCVHDSHPCERVAELGERVCRKIKVHL